MLTIRQGGNMNVECGSSLVKGEIKKELLVSVNLESLLDEVKRAKIIDVLKSSVDNLK